MGIVGAINFPRALLNMAFKNIRMNDDEFQRGGAVFRLRRVAGWPPASSAIAA
jgi:hypothetical protein